MDKKNLIFWVVSLVFVIGGLYFYGDRMGPGAGRTTEKVQFSALPPGGEFTLESLDGPVRLSDFQGKVVVLYFGYTFCPDLCPTSLQTMAAAFKRFSEEQQKNLQGLMISVDPKRDTLKKLKEYVGFFDSGFIGVTGSEKQLDELKHKYDINFIYGDGYEDSENYGVDHTSYIYVIDPKGRLSHRVKHGIRVENLVQIIGKTL